ncbi:MAG: NAD-dependent dihydropyrimidine dehydrogenase subunit PreA [Oscillospiraceae bacterium]|nr:NAD-dependent dihydropyrimidine dehydrogenase subunit PreA [Oscillospiraceae bacterium]
MKYGELILNNEAARCMLCADAPCTAACPKGFDPARFIRAARFENAAVGAGYIDSKVCAECTGECERACLHYQQPVEIRRMAAAAPEPVKPEELDLSMDFCGVRCENPFFLSSSVVASSYEMCANALRAGWGGIVYKTIGFIKPDEVSPRFDAIGKESTPFIGFKNLEQISDHPLKENLEILKRLKTEFPTKIIVSSIMGSTEEEWTELARLSEEAGCDIIECNFSCPQMVGEGLGSDVGQNPDLVRSYTAAAKRGTKLPVLAKMTPNIGNMEIPAIAAREGGADGIAAINTVKSLTRIDLDTMVSYPGVNGKCSVSGYSGKAVKPIALRFIHDMAVCPELKGVPLSGIGGIESWQDALEFIALGCENIQITTAVMQYGYRIIDDLITGTQAYLKSHGMTSLRQLTGKALADIVPADDLDRSTVVYPIFDDTSCVGCGRCYVSCMDGGHQAIALGEDRKPHLTGGKCVGCLLCSLVCPTGSIKQSRRVKKTGR